MDNPISLKLQKCCEIILLIMDSADLDEYSVKLMGLEKMPLYKLYKGILLLLFDS